MNFGQAIEALKEGKKAARDGWNGKGQWIVLVGSEVTAFTPKVQMELLNRSVHACVAIVNAQGMLVPGWVPSQTDMLSEDWQIIE